MFVQRIPQGFRVKAGFLPSLSHSGSRYVCASAVFYEKPSAWCLFYQSSWQRYRVLPIKADTNTTNPTQAQPIRASAPETLFNEEIRLSSVRMFIRI